MSPSGIVDAVVGRVNAHGASDSRTRETGSGECPTSDNTEAVQLSLGIPYDDDHDGLIGGPEILDAVRDYFVDKLTGQQILALVRLYFGS